MDWTAGYASDVEYTAGFYQEQSPSYLNFVAALNGYEPVAAEAPFTYFELGFGRGLTANLLAASNPAGQFYAADFNPAHVAGARALADAAGLSNLTLLESSFAELAAGAAALPQFDYITLHGIYTWVTAQNRRHIVDFIARYLKPGGLVYLSYNAMPGWAPSQPLQRLLVEYGDAHPGRSDVQIDGAAGLVRQLVEAGAAYFEHNPTLSHRVDMLAKGRRNYLAHEYMHKHWQPLYHADVARDLRQAKLDFVGRAEFPYVYTSLYLPAAKQALLDTFADPAMRETLKDYFLDTGFRKDVFVRGARRMSAARHAEWMGRLHAVLTVPRERVVFRLKLVFGEVDGNALYAPVCDALAQRPHSLAELAALPALRGQGAPALAQIIALLAATGQVGYFYGEAGARDAAAGQRMNRAVAAQVRYGDEYTALCSPLLGNGVVASYVERMAYLAVAGDPSERPAVDTLVRDAWRHMVQHGRAMVKDGQPLVGEADNLAELRRQIVDFLEHKLPLWRTLKML